MPATDIASFKSKLLEGKSPTPVELSTLLMEAIPQSMNAIRAELRSRRGNELTVPQFRTLFRLRRGPKTNKELAESLGVSVPSMSRLVAGLVDRQLVKRTVAPKDRREYRLHLTSQGEKLVSEIREKSIQDLAKKIKSLDPEEQEALCSAAHLLTVLFKGN